MRNDLQSGVGLVFSSKDKQKIIDQYVTYIFHSNFTEFTYFKLKLYFLGGMWVKSEDIFKSRYILKSI